MYQYVGQFFLEDYKWNKYFKAQDVVDFSEGTLEIDDIILLPTKYDYGMGTSYPIDKMTFYRSDLDFEIVDRIKDTEYGLSRP